MAGSETTASQLSGLTALLLQNPNCLERLKKEVRSAFKSDKDITSTSVTSLRYLQACLDEGLRCYPPVAGGLLRVVPKGGNIIEGEHVPEGASIPTPSRLYSNSV
jgi:cytochrome P450